MQNKLLLFVPRQSLYRFQKFLWWDWQEKRIHKQGRDTNTAALSKAKFRFAFRTIITFCSGVWWVVLARNTILKDKLEHTQLLYEENCFSLVHAEYCVHHPVFHARLQAFPLPSFLHPFSYLLHPFSSLRCPPLSLFPSLFWQSSWLSGPSTAQIANNQRRQLKRRPAKKYFTWCSIRELFEFPLSPSPPLVLPSCWSQKGVYVTCRHRFSVPLRSHLKEQGLRQYYTCWSELKGGGCSGGVIWS